MVHGGRANILTIGGNVAAVAGDAVGEYYFPMTRGGSKSPYYSARVCIYRVAGGDGANTSLITKTY